MKTHLLRLTSYPAPRARSRSSSPALPSEITTDGVYKLQGRIRRGFVSRRYWEFHVHGAGTRADPVPRERSVGRTGSVLRVQPSASGGITDLLSPDPPARHAPVCGSHAFRQLSPGSPHAFAAAMHHPCAPRGPVFGARGAGALSRVESN